MASTLTVDNIVGATTSNTVHLPGHIIQIQSAPLLGQVSLSTNSTFHAVGHSLNFTPKFSTSKVFVMLSTTIVHSNSAGDNLVEIVRGSTSVTESNIYSGNTGWKGYTVTLSKLDSPATTSQITYTVRCWFDGGGQMIYNYTNQGYSESNLIAMEVAQ